MLRSMLWVLRQRRYQALAAGAVALAAGCAIAGTWQVYRFDASVHDNDALRANAHAAPVALTTALVPLTGTAPAPSAEAIRYRTVTATGTYLATRQTYLRGQQVSGADGFYVLTPLRTDAGVLLVARGFVSDGGRLTPPSDVAPAPAGTVRVTGRLETPDTAADDADRLGHAMVDSVNPAAQAARLSAPTYDAYLQLDPEQPGADGLTALPAPDLTNPAGGAYEWQHFAYILQWYVFALLALAMPFVFARHEVREARQRFLGIDPGAEQFDAELAPDGVGRPELPAPPSEPGALLPRTGTGELVRPGGPTAEQWRRAQVLADRYGRSLGPGGPPRSVTRAGRRRGPARHGGDEPIAVPSSAREPHRSEGDRFHGAYNDYLWELALADGDMPDVLLSPDGPVDPRADFPMPEPHPVGDDEPDPD